jgi:MYXO-CTERM domain-containing protein
VTFRARAVACLAAAAVVSIALSAPAHAVPEDPPAYPSPEWTAREAANFAKVSEAPAEQTASPEFQQRITAQNAVNLQSFLQRQADDPSWVGATTGNLCETYMWQCAGDPFRYPEAPGPNGAAFYENEAVVEPVVFYDAQCARLVGQVWRPKAVAPGAKLPNVVIETGSVQAPSTIYWYFAQSLVRSGYAVLTYDVRGQGRSDQRTPAGDQGGNSNPSVFWDGLVNAIDFFRSTPSTPYPHNLSCAGTKPTVVTPFNPFHDVLDPERLGIAGHSLGATGVSTVQAYDAPGEPTWVQGGGKLDATNPVKVVVAWDSLSAEAPRVPALDMPSEYGLAPTPKTSPPDPEGHKASFSHWVEAGQAVMTVTIQGSTHYEYSLIPTFPTTSWQYGNPLVTHYSQAWIDRWLKRPGEAGYADADARLLDDASWSDRMSFYSRSARSFPTRSGALASCDDIRAGCSDVTPAVPEAPAKPLAAFVALAVGALFVARRRRAPRS